MTFEGELHHSMPYPLSGKVEARIQEPLLSHIMYVLICFRKSIPYKIVNLIF